MPTSITLNIFFICLMLSLPEMLHSVQQDEDDLSFPTLGHMPCLFIVTGLLFILFQIIFLKVLSATCNLFYFYVCF